MFACMCVGARSCQVDAVSDPSRFPLTREHWHKLQFGSSKQCTNPPCQLEKQCDIPKSQEPSQPSQPFQDQEEQPKSTDIIYIQADVKRRTTLTQQKRSVLKPDLQAWRALSQSALGCSLSLTPFLSANL